VEQKSRRASDSQVGSHDPVPTVLPCRLQSCGKGVSWEMLQHSSASKPHPSGCWANPVWVLHIKVPGSTEKVESEEYQENCESKEKLKEEKQEESEKAEPSPEPLGKGESLWLRRVWAPF